MIFKNFWNKTNLISKHMEYYDGVVNEFNCLHVWKCSRQYIINHYRSHISNYHLEIGPGSGYFLKRDILRKNPSINKLTLIDVNDDILDYSKQNLKDEYSNDITTLNTDIFSHTIPSDIQFKSVGINYVLHCIPGSLHENIDTLLTNLNSTNYNIFGATVISDPIHMNPIAEYELMVLNSLGIFNNKNDTYEEFQEYLINQKIKHNITKRGYVALFTINI